MNTIENYVEAMFSNLPKNAEVISVKSDILSNMQEKYAFLLEEGISENEAVGIVISEFGQIDELIDNLDIEVEKQPDLDKPIIKPLSHEYILDYLATRKKIGLLIGLGVVLCTIGVSSLLFFNAYGSLFGGMISLILLLAIGVSLFIYSGMSMTKFTAVEKDFSISIEDEAMLESFKQSYVKSFTLSMICGVILCLMSLLPLFLVILVNLPIILGVVMLLGIASLGTFFFIYAGNVYGSFTYLLDYKIKVDITPEQLKQHQFWTRFSEIYWISIVIMFFVLGFVFGAWKFAWIIFPVGGIISSFWSNK